jgi:hypothetical protein
MPLFGRKKKEEAPKQQDPSIQLPVFNEEMFPKLEESPKQIEKSIEKPTPIQPQINQKIVEKRYEIPTEKPIVIPIQITQPVQHYPQPTQIQPSQQYPQIMERQTVPVFVKLERYNQILQSMDELKRSLEVIKETVDVFNELERVKTDNLKMLQSAIDRVDKKILTLDSTFTRPSGYEESSEQSYTNEDLEDELSTLRKQVTSIRSELKKFA